jgi:hypothetical protein
VLDVSASRGVLHTRAITSVCSSQSLSQTLLSQAGGLAFLVLLIGDHASVAKSFLDTLGVSKHAFGVETRLDGP